jgi:hypothetical protein
VPEVGEPPTPWLTLGFGWEMRDRDRVEQLIGRRDRVQTEAVADDETLRDRYRRSGIDAVLLTLAIVDPIDDLRRTIRRPMAPASWGAPEYERGMFIEASVHDDQSYAGPLFDQWLAQQVRAVLEGWQKLAT